MSIPFDPAAVRELANILADTGLTEIEIEGKDGRIRVVRAAPQVMSAPAVTVPVVAAPAAAAAAAAFKGLESAVADLLAARRTEGAALQVVLLQRVERIAQLTGQAEACPGRQPDAIKARLAQSIATLTDASPALDPVRLHQEAVMLAAKADVREELDRLQTHVAAARALLASDQPVGRKLDFLAQEFGREANTLCSKSNDPALTSIGMDLRVEIEQFREQVQNIE